MEYEALKKPFSPEEVDLKVQATNRDRTKGMVVAYVDARAVIDRLDEAVGVGGWTDTYEVLTNSTLPDGTRIVEVKCRLTVEGITKEDVGEGDTLKAAFSDALKRAAVKFGVGRYLYRLPRVWADLDANGAIRDYAQVKAKLLGGQVVAQPEPQPQQQTQAQPQVQAQRSGGISQKQMDYIRRLAKELDPSAGEEDVLSLASAALGRDVEDLASLTLKEASQVIEHMKELKAGF